MSEEKRIEISGIGVQDASLSFEGIKEEFEKRKELTSEEEQFAKILLDAGLMLAEELHNCLSAYEQNRGIPAEIVMKSWSGECKLKNGVAVFTKITWPSEK